MIDNKGKEKNLTTWKFVRGVRHLSWLSPAPTKKPDDKKPDDKKPKEVAPVETGPPALVFREMDSTTYADGIVTLIPLESIRELSYDYENQKTTVRVATSDKKEDDVVLTGTAAKYRGFNVVTIEAEIDFGGLGVAEAKFKGGEEGGIQGFRNESPKPFKAEAAGRKSQITVEGQKDPISFMGLKALYKTEAGEKTSDTLFFKKTIKAPFEKLNGLKAADKGIGAEWTLELRNGESQTFTLRDPAPLDGKAAKLQGLLATTKGGYRLFPMHTMREIKLEPDKSID